MAQRQRVGFQIQRLGVRIPLGSFLSSNRAWMAEWSKALDLSSSGRKSAWVRTPLQALFYLQKVRHPGIEPGASAWEAPMLPLHQWRSIFDECNR